MGDPRRIRRKWKPPRKRWDAERIREERKLMRQYGLRRKKEIRRAEEIVRRLRRRARSLIANPNEEEEKSLIKKAYEMGLVDENATLDDILSITVKDLLERRLQTMVYRLGLARTIKQARQFIVHGHIMVDGQRVVTPSYIVHRDEENTIDFHPNSPIKEMYEKGFGIFADFKNKGAEVQNQ